MSSCSRPLTSQIQTQQSIVRWRLELGAQGSEPWDLGIGMWDYDAAKCGPEKPKSS